MRLSEFTTKILDSILPRKNTRVKSTKKIVQISEKIPKEDKIDTTKKIPTKTNLTNKYLYLADEDVFKTENALNPIKISGEDALFIIRLRNQGLTYNDIYAVVDWKHKCGKSSVENFARKYNLGLMDDALMDVTSDVNFLHAINGDI